MYLMFLLLSFIIFLFFVVVVNVCFSMGLIMGFMYLLMFLNSKGNLYWIVSFSCFKKLELLKVLIWFFSCLFFFFLI